MKARTLTAAALVGLLLAPLAAYAAPGAPPVAGEVTDPVIQYSDPLSYTIRWTVQDGSPVSLAVTGLPSEFSFVDNGDGSGAITGEAASPAGDYPFTLTATEADGTQHQQDVTLTVVREDAVIRMARTNPDAVSRRRPFVVRARVKDAPDGSFGDITRAGSGVFILEDRRGHLRTCPADVVPGSLDTGAGPDFYDVRCRVPSGLHRGQYRLTYAVTSGYYVGHRAGEVRITR
jgi:hypothetical protein